MRLFVAIELAEGAAAELRKVQRTLEPSCPGVRWVRPEQMHLTVKFLGEVEDQRVVEIAQVLQTAAEQSAPFGMSVRACGCFPPRGPVRVIWAGDHEANEPLLSCVEAVEREMEGSGFPREGRRFSAHITLARVHDDRSQGAVRTAVGAAEVSVVSQDVASLVLMSSKLGRGGSTYAVVSRAALGRGKP